MATWGNFQRQAFIKAMEKKRNEAKEVAEYFESESGKWLMKAIRNKYDQATEIDWELPF